MIGLGYDQQLADRVRRLLRPKRGVVERQMFGGLALMYRGRMVCGVVNDELMVRVGRQNYEEMLRLPSVRPMDFTGRPLRGFVFVRRQGVVEEDDLRSWIARGLTAARARPSLKKTKKG